MKEMEWLARASTEFQLTALAPIRYSPRNSALCPGCNFAITPTDALCENCGHKLR